MSYVRVWIHAVWGTKNRDHLLVNGTRSQIISHILETVRAYIDNQEEHHKKRTYVEEVGEFLQKYNSSHHG